VRWVAVAALAALALAGCGDDLEEFRADLRPLEQRAAAQRAEISTELRSVRLGSKGDARALRAKNAQLRDAYDAIAELEPPDAYEEPFTAYVRANDRTVRDLEGFAGKLAAGDARALRRASRRVLADLARSQTARLQWLE
jgi:hypothetical protein